MRKVFEIKNDAIKVVVHYSSEWQEYRARLYVGNKAHAPADYYTNDQDDAEYAARVMFDLNQEKGA
jgi:hypothetical protein